MGDKNEAGLHERNEAVGAKGAKKRWRLCAVREMPVPPFHQGLCILGGGPAERPPLPKRNVHRFLLVVVYSVYTAILDMF